MMTGRVKDYDLVFSFSLDRIYAPLYRLPVIFPGRKNESSLVMAD